MTNSQSRGFFAEPRCFPNNLAPRDIPYRLISSPSTPLYERKPAQPISPGKIQAESA